MQTVFEPAWLHLLPEVRKRLIYALPIAKLKVDNLYFLVLLHTANTERGTKWLYSKKYYFLKFNENLMVCK